MDVLIGSTHSTHGYFEQDLIVGDQGQMSFDDRELTRLLVVESSHFGGDRGLHGEETRSGVISMRSIGWERAEYVGIIGWGVIDYSRSNGRGDVGSQSVGKYFLRGEGRAQ